MCGSGCSDGVPVGCVMAGLFKCKEIILPPGDSLEIRMMRRGRHTDGGKGREVGGGVSLVRSDKRKRIRRIERRRRRRKEIERRKGL